MSSEQTLRDRLLKIIGDEEPYKWASRNKISKSTLFNIINKDGNPRADQLLKISKATGFSMEWLLTGDDEILREHKTGTVTPADVWFWGDNDKTPPSTTPPHAQENKPDFIQVPRYEIAASAGGGTVVQSEQIVDFISFKEEWVRNSLGASAKDLALISVKGDSMEPTLSDGDLVLVDISSRTIEANAIYVLQFWGSLMVKRIQRKVDGTVVIKSDNHIYETETITGELLTQLNIIGRVVWYGKRA
jgi:phage repressor protein C with HTH and peptisase S24 domain